MIPASVIVVIPCYNEEHRLEPDLVLELLARPEVSLLFVDDGSTDGTLARLRELERGRAGRVAVLALSRNLGKAEAVRAGLCHSLERGADVVGYLDADMATSAGELLRLLDVLIAERAAAVIGSRLRVLGAEIERTRGRYYLGQVFSLAAELVLGVAVGDTQCGAKLFRRTPALEAALAVPFHSRWAFDVELLARLLAGSDARRDAGILEVPLRRWSDVAGSKLTLRQMLRSGVDLARIAWLTWAVSRPGGRRGRGPGRA